MAEELKIMQKVFDMMQYGYGALAQYPKSEKFALCTDIKRCMDTMLERTIEAQKKYYKKTTLQDLDVEVAKLRAYLKSERCSAVGLKPSRASRRHRVSAVTRFLFGRQLEQLFLWLGFVQRQQPALEHEDEHWLPRRFTS